MTEAYRVAERALWRAYGVTPVERFLDLAGGPRVRIQEVGEGPPALVVHGAMTAGSSFAPLVARLAGLRCLVLDRPGCGLSDGWRLDAQFRDQAAGTIGAVLDGLGLDSVLLIGNSLGGLWATWFALAHPQRVRGLAVLGPSIGFPGVRPPGFMRIAAIPGIGALLPRLMRPSPAAVRRIFTAMGHGKSLAAGRIPPEIFDWSVQVAAETATQRNDFVAVRRAVGLTGARPWIQLSEEALRALSVPTLLAAGTDDTHGGPALASRAAALIPRATVHVVDDAGHVPWLDDPAAVAAAVLAFDRPATSAA